MARPCSICGHADLQAINKALQGGDSLDDVSERFKLSRSALQRHRAAHLAAKPVAKPAKAAKAKAKPRRAPAKPRDRSRAAQKAVAPVTSVGEPTEPQRKPLPKPSADRESRVRACMELMAAGRWESGVTPQELAAEWGMAEGSLAHIAGEASRRVKAVGEQDFVRTRISAALDEGLGIALSMARGVNANGVTIPGDPRALGGLASIAKAYRELASPAATATAPQAREPVTIIYPAGVAPLPPDGPPLQPPAGPDAPASPARS